MMTKSASDSTTFIAPSAPGNPNGKPPFATANPRCEITLITPALAGELLGKNTRNRKIKKAHLQRLVRDMKNGRWQFNPQPISFGVDGSLLDGQHRLTAIVESGVSARMVVWFDVPLAARAGMDQGAIRRPEDLFDGLDVRTTAIVRATMRGLRAVSTPSASEVNEFYRLFISEIHLARSLASNKNKLKSASIAAVFARAACGHIEIDVVSRFAAIMDSGISERPEDQTIISLRDRLLSMRSQSGAESCVEMYGLTSRALVAYRDGVRLSKLYPSKEELFQLPSRTGE